MNFPQFPVRLRNGQAAQIGTEDFRPFITFAYCQINGPVRFYDGPPARCLGHDLSNGDIGALHFFYGNGKMFLFQHGAGNFHLFSRNVGNGYTLGTPEITERKEGPQKCDKENPDHTENNGFL